MNWSENNSRLWGRRILNFQANHTCQIRVWKTQGFAIGWLLEIEKQEYLFNSTPHFLIALLLSYNPKILRKRNLVLTRSLTYSLLVFSEDCRAFFNTYWSVTLLLAAVDARQPLGCVNQVLFRIYCYFINIIFHKNFPCPLIKVFFGLQDFMPFICLKNSTN